MTRTESGQFVPGVTKTLLLYVTIRPSRVIFKRRLVVVVAVAAVVVVVAVVVVAADVYVHADEPCLDDIYFVVPWTEDII